MLSGILPPSIQHGCICDLRAGVVHQLRFLSPLSTSPMRRAASGMASVGAHAQHMRKKPGSVAWQVWPGVSSRWCCDTICCHKACSPAQDASGSAARRSTCVWYKRGVEFEA